jgi:hypothetical protein
MPAHRSVPRPPVRPAPLILAFLLLAGTAAGGESPYHPLRAPFGRAFTLWADDSLTVDWTPAQFDTFMDAVFDSGSATGGGTFARVWPYFCSTDRDSSWDGILFRSGITDTRTIELHLTRGGGFPHAAPGRMWLNAYAADGRPHDPRTLAGSWELAHELAHVAFFADEEATRGVGHGTWTDELFAEGAGTVLGLHRPSRYAIEYDRSLPSAATPPEYQQFRLFQAYLAANYGGDPGDPTDDLLYRWIRRRPRDPGFVGLAATLDSLGRAGDPAAARLGTGAAATIAGLFLEFAAAKVVDGALPGPYGFGGYDGPKAVNLFTWVDPNARRDRVVPPEIRVGAAAAPVEIATVVDPVQPDSCGRTVKDLGIRRWGADYLVFLPEPAVRGDAAGRSLEITIEPRGDPPAGTLLRGTWVAMAGEGPALGDRKATALGPVAAWRPGDSALTFTVPRFGEDAGAYVLVLSLTEDPIRGGSIPNCIDASTVCPQAAGACSTPDLDYAVRYRLVGDPDAGNR